MPSGSRQRAVRSGSWPTIRWLPPADAFRRGGPSALDRADGERPSYLEIADAISRYGARADADRRELYRRLAFNVLVSNVDDHLRNDGFLWGGREGWRLLPAFDLNPTPVDVRERTLTTSSQDAAAAQSHIADMRA